MFYIIQHIVRFMIVFFYFERVLLLAEVPAINYSDSTALFSTINQKPFC